jgi:hypothetical protein
VSRVNDDRQLRFRDDFVKRIHASIVCVKLLQWRVKFESTYTQSVNRCTLPNSLAPRVGSTLANAIMKSNADARFNTSSLGTCGQAGDAFVDGENHASDFA